MQLYLLCVPSSQAGRFASRIFASDSTAKVDYLLLSLLHSSFTTAALPLPTKTGLSAVVKIDLTLSRTPIDWEISEFRQWAIVPHDDIVIFLHCLEE